MANLSGGGRIQSQLGHAQVLNTGFLRSTLVGGTDEATHRPEPKKVEEMFLEERKDTHHKGAQGTHEKGCS